MRRGETLFSIAWRYGKDPADVARWNRLGSGSLIHPGDVIRIDAATQWFASPFEAHGVEQTASRPRPCPRSRRSRRRHGSGRQNGRISVEFGGKPGTGTGVLIDGKVGQPITACGIRAASSMRAVD